MKKALLLGSLPAIAIASGLFLSNTEVSGGKYEQRLSSHIQSDESTIDKTFEFYEMIYGEYDSEDRARALEISKNIAQDRADYNWMDLGPDNVGGRTRAILVDRSNINHLYAGAVSGGLFESINRGGTWDKVEDFADNLSISSMCQTIDGTYYAATGHKEEQVSGVDGQSGGRGYGAYIRNADGSWSLIEGTENYTYINEIACDDVNNFVWIASSSGLKKYDPSTGELESISSFGGAGTACTSLTVSGDGQVIVGYAVGGGPSVALASENGGATFSEVSESSEVAGKINSIGVGRLEFAISHEKVDGKYYVYGSGASGQLRGIWRSENNGMTWERIAPAYTGEPGGFGPFTSGGVSGQGLYNNIITVVPGAPDRILLGGIDCYQWKKGGNWEQISQWFLSPTNPLYVHADNHEFTWDANGRLYIGNDGGIAFSDNATTLDPTFHPANRGYGVTQFYATGVSAHGDVVGGTQDNGVQANYHTGTTWREHDRIGGGDGFSADISFINRNLTFGSVYFSAVYRSSDRGENPSPFIPDPFEAPASPCTPGAIDGTGCGQFVTQFKMWENPNDLASTDTLDYIAPESYNAGDIIQVPSATTQTFIPYESPIDIVFDDTLVYDDALTFNDTVVVDEITGGDFNLGLLEWDFIFGAPAISDGDSILIIGVEENDTIIVESFSTIDHYVGTNDLKPGEEVDMGNDSVLYNIAWDTLRVQDPYQSWFALDMGTANGVWMTRNALRFSAQEEAWFKIAEGMGTISTMEFSKDGDYLFIGTYSGQLWRVTGFNDAYSPTEILEGPTMGGITYDTLIDHMGNRFVTELQQIESLPGPVTGIASGPLGNPDYLVVTLGNYVTSGRVRESTNATGVDPSFTALNFPGDEGTGAAEAGIPCFSVIVDRDDINTIVVGTEFGAYVTEDGGANWSDITGKFGRVAIFDMQQNWRTWDEGCKRPGEVYIGTHGRGIWSTDALLSTPDSDNLVKEKFQVNISLYPNPVMDQATVDFNLDSNGDVQLQIFNLNGQMVQQVVSTDLQEGANKIAFDAQDLPRGTYILRLNAENFSETTKFIKH